MPRADTDRLYDLLNDILVVEAAITLDEFVEGRRDSNRRMSWDDIAYELRYATEVKVSGEWLRLRYGENGG